MGVIMLNREESEYALAKIFEVLNSPHQPGIDYDALKAAADRHTARIREIDAAQSGARERYMTDAKFYYLVSWIRKLINEGSYTLQNIRDAVDFVAQTGQDHAKKN
jgi:hypothetical protein